MTTIPIEVIVQDAESPVAPTPVDPTDQGENTNITVPETGAGAVDSNSGINSSSAVISIVSIVIAVLAIGAVIALLARRYYKRKNLNTETGMTRQEKRAMAVTSTIAVLALTVLLGQLVIAGIVSPLVTNAATSEEAELDVDDKITIVATRTEDEEVVVATVKNTSTATSHQTFGYKVTASMAADATTANLYLDGDETSEYYIAPVSNEEDEALEINTWGYALAEESEGYLPIPLATDPATIVKGYDNIYNEPVDIYYIIQVDKDLPAGTYTGTLEYTLTDNNFPSTLTTMQGMTTKICEDTFTPGNQVTDPVPTATLKDIRDDKTYTIAKLADGNCWMTQNLDLDLSTETTLTPEDTNITTNWTPANSTIYFGREFNITEWRESGSYPYSLDLGDSYYYTSDTGTNDIKYGSLEECEAAGHTDCSHYHAGNYYNWSAAVASNDTSGMTEQYQNAPDSICPAGWRLPEGPNDNDPNYGEMVNSVRSYGGILEDTITESCGGGCNYYGYLEGGLNSVRIRPLWLTRSGVITYSSMHGNYLYGAASFGNYYTSTIYSNNQTYAVVLHSDGVGLTRKQRSTGQSIRCVAE